MKRQVVIKLSRQNYRKLLLTAKTSGFKDIHSYLVDTIHKLPVKVCFHSLYICWLNMRERCLRPSHPDFKHYGAKGVKICDYWLGKYGFEQFLESVPPRKELKGAKGRTLYSLDRKNPEGNYEPDNVRWATWTQQVKNRRPGIKRKNKEVKKIGK